MKNTLLSVTALVVMNGVQQLLIYPYLTRQMGAAAFGDILVVLGIIAIIAPALGRRSTTAGSWRSKNMNAATAMPIPPSCCF